MALALVMVACQREERRFHPQPGAAATVPPVLRVDLEAGPRVRPVGAPRGPTAYNPYEKNAYAVSQGKTLYNLYNCSGCHAQGGGGMGPPLMDAEWIYGSRPENIFETIVQGRPSGMPAYGSRIVEDQIWQLVAYVRSMSGLLRKDVAPGRADDMQVRTQEQSTRPAERP